MLNHHLFSLINAPPGLTPAQLFLPMTLARWSVHGAALVLVVGWLVAEREVKAELVRFAMCATIALLFACAAALAVQTLDLHAADREVIAGTRYLARGWLPDVPSRSVAMLWAAAFTAFGHGRLSVAGPFLLTLGLVVGWSRIYLGASLPGDVLAALPVAAAAAAVTWWARAPIYRLALRLEGTHA
ncbi:hypothetical protein [Roseateles sp. L2-2]|uniref:hypothetical protein n=1 Tax=Roseateles sp. L2-2 TaxID=3422597 RepID=UPI003D3609B5